MNVRRHAEIWASICWAGESTRLPDGSMGCQGAQGTHARDFPETLTNLIFDGQMRQLSIETDLAFSKLLNRNVNKSVECHCWRSWLTRQPKGRIFELAFRYVKAAEASYVSLRGGPPRPPAEWKPA